MLTTETIDDLSYNGVHNVDSFIGIGESNKSVEVKEESVNKFCEMGGCPTGTKKLGFITLLLWFIILALIFWIILYAWKPTLVQQTDQRGNPTGEPDGLKVLVFSLIIALIIVILIFIFFNCTRW